MAILNENKMLNEEVNDKEYRIDCEKNRYPTNDHSIEVFELPTYDGTCNGFGINWSAKGTQSIEETQKFIKNLETAVKAAKTLDKKYKGRQVY